MRRHSTNLVGFLIIFISFMYDSFSFAGTPARTTKTDSNITSYNHFFYPGQPTVQITLLHEEPTYDHVFEEVAGWSIVPECAWNVNEDQEHCVFTSQTFAAGRGISILTNPWQISEILQLPAFADPDIHATLGVNHHPNPPFFAKEMPGHGVGLIANRTIQRGEILMAFTPAFMTPEETYEDLSLKERLNLQRLAFERLPAVVRSLAESLAGQGDAPDSRDDIMNTNSFVFPITTSSGDKSGVLFVTQYKFLFPEIARFNHACRPSVDYFFDQSTLTLHMVASRAVFPGEELTISYIDPFQKRRARMKALKQSWGFWCDCSLCSASPELVKESDARIDRLLEIKEELEDHSAESEGNPGMAEVYVDLIKKEQVWLRMHEAYAVAAVEYNGVGDEKNAVRMSRKALGYGSLCRGPLHGGEEKNEEFGGVEEEESYEDMERLRRDPHGHPSRMFRLKDGGE